MKKIINGRRMTKRAIIKGTGKKYTLPEFHWPADTSCVDNLSVVYTAEVWGNRFHYAPNNPYGLSQTLENALRFRGYGETIDGMIVYYNPYCERRIIKKIKEVDPVDLNDWAE